MGSKLGAKKNKTIPQINEDEIEDVAFTETPASKKTTPKKEEEIIDYTDAGSPTGKIETTTKKESKPEVKVEASKDDSKGSKKQPPVDTSFLTNPDSLEKKIKLQDSSKDSNSPLDVPTTDETDAEGATMKRLGFTMDESPDDFEPVNPGSFSGGTKTAAGGGNKGGMGNIPPPPGGQKTQFQDDVPPPNPYDDDSFDEMDDDGGLGAGDGGLSIPAGLNTWAATRQADWIVDTEDKLLTGFLRNRAKLNIIEIRQRLLKYKTPADVNNDVLGQSKEYNLIVEEYIKMDNASRKMLKKGWIKVLSKHSEVAKNISDEAQLLISHLIIFGGMFMVGNQLKKTGLDVMQGIDDSIKRHAIKFQQKNEFNHSDINKKADDGKTGGEKAKEDGRTN